MYRLLESPLDPRYSRMYVGSGTRLNTGPASIDDIVTVRADTEVDFYIIVEISHDDFVSGEIVGIGPNPRHEFNGWASGDKFRVQESAITAIIRRN